MSNPINKKDTNILADKDKFAFRNKSFQDLQGEIWKEIPISAFEGNILISSYGRVKSLERLVQRPNGKLGIKPEKILSPYIEKVEMKKNKNVWYVVGICIGYDKKFYNLLISRWMYYLFVEPFDMNDKTLVVTFKDSDNTNLRPDNLILSSRGAEIKRSFEKGARERNAFNTTPKKVIQLNESNKIINSFPSITQAAKYLKVDSKTVWGILKGKFKNKYNLHYAGSES